MPTVPFEKWLQSVRALCTASGEDPEVDEDLAQIAYSMEEKTPEQAAFELIDAARQIRLSRASKP
jgi:hypothetical protein